MKTIITNTQGEKIIVEVDIPAAIKGIVFVAHGLGGFKEQVHIVAFSQAFNEADFLTVRWDARKTVGESEGKLIDATLSDYLADFKTVVAWASHQTWYREPFIVCGHSLGAACAFLFTLAQPEKISGIVGASAFISATEFEKSFTSDVLNQWKQTGIREWISSSQPGVVKRLKWAFMEDAREYTLMEDIPKINQPVLLIVGSSDTDTPVELQQKVFETLASQQKELHIIDGAEHTFKNDLHLNKIRKIITDWLGKIE